MRILGQCPICYFSQRSRRGLLLTNCCATVKKMLHFQSGFRKYHSTETALLKVQNDILLSMDRQEVCFLVLLDLSSAFDAIDHKAIIEVLEHQFGVTDKALEWIKSFLSNRKQRVDLDNNFSEVCDVNYGVPQGSCLGPILFLLIYPNYMTL